MSAPGTGPGRPGIRDRIEAGMERWGRWATHHARPVIAGSLALVAILASFLPALRIDVSDKGFLHEDDPVRRAYDTFGRQFGADEVVVLAIEPPEIFEPAFLARLRALHREMEALDQIEDVTSLVNARNTYGRGDELVVEDLLEVEPRTPDDLERLREQVFANPLYLNTLISGDGRATTMVIQPDRFSSLGALGGTETEAALSDDVFEADEPALLASEDALDPIFMTEQEQLRVAQAIVAVVEQYDAPDFPIHATGGPIFEFWMNEQMQRDILLSLTSSALLIALLLFLLFRRVSGVLLPLTVVALALLCAASSMALAGVPITLPIQILPSFLLAVGVCSAVHLLVLTFRAIDRGATREDAIAGAMAHAGLPVAMAGLTTAGGLASFAGSPLAPVSHFGIFGPIGVLFTLLFVLVLLPSLLAVTPIRRRPPPTTAEGPEISDRVLLALGGLATRHARAILAATLALVVLAVAGIAQLGFSHHPMDWIPEESDLARATAYLDEHFNAASGLDMLLEIPGQENGFKDPEVLQQLDTLRTRLLALEVDGIHAANSTSIADIVKETHQALNENQPDFYRVPDDARLVAQELLLFENAGSDDMEDFVDSRFMLASYSLQIPWRDAIEMVPFIDAVEKIARETMVEPVVVTLTGGTVIFSRIFAAVIRSMASSYFLALLIITPLMILLIGTLRVGLLSMAPNLLPIVLTLGFMGWAGYSLDFSTMMIGAIVLGVAVDDTIHFMHVFQRYYREGGDPARAVEQTLTTTGRAILYTTIVLCVGFSGFVLATMENLASTGVLTCFAIGAALLADVLVAPALVMLFLPVRASGTAGSEAPSIAAGS